MKVETAWVSPPQAIGGLDHLGTQAPCVLIYSQLLPGITNVTDRARYYSFYPWLIWSFDQRYAKDDEARAWYEALNFESSPTDPYHLFLLLKDLRALLGA